MTGKTYTLADIGLTGSYECSSEKSTAVVQPIDINRQMDGFFGIPPFYIPRGQCGFNVGSSMSTSEFMYTCYFDWWLHSNLQLLLLPYGRQQNFMVILRDILLYAISSFTRQHLL